MGKSTQSWVAVGGSNNGIVGKTYRHEIGFFTTPLLISIIFLKPTLIIYLHMCPNQYILLLIVYIIFSVFKLYGLFKYVLK